jgi:hypothetical protein
MGTRAVVRADALFEAVLGLVLVVGVASGGLGAADFPHPADDVVIAIVGCVPLLVALVLWYSAVPLTALAAGTVVTAIAAVIWLVAASGFSTAGGSVLVVTAVALLCLAAAQLTSHHRRAH